jgi:hypothetical protein
MNERIRELIKQATEYDYTTWDSYNQKELVYYKFNQEKFAELIVKECMNRVRSRQQFAGEDQQNVTQAFDLLVYDLESHFGVEE